MIGDHEFRSRALELLKAFEFELQDSRGSHELNEDAEMPGNEATGQFFAPASRQGNDAEGQDTQQRRDATQTKAEKASSGGPEPPIVVDFFP